MLAQIAGRRISRKTPMTRPSGSTNGSSGCQSEPTDGVPRRLKQRWREERPLCRREVCKARAKTIRRSPATAPTFEVRRPVRLARDSQRVSTPRRVSISRAGPPAGKGAISCHHLVVAPGLNHVPRRPLAVTARRARDPAGQSVTDHLGPNPGATATCTRLGADRSLARRRRRAFGGTP